MKILHTSDWHVGKVLKGQDRYDEHAAVLGDIIRVARTEDVDLVLVAGDLFDSAAPSARAQGLVMRTLLALGRDGRHVVAIAGNHDSPGLLDAVYRPALGQAGLHVLGTPRRPSRGGMLTLRARTGETVNVAAMPFMSHRQAATAAEALPPDLAEHALDYPSQIAAMMRVLTRRFTPDAVNVVVAYAALAGGSRGGGERDAQPSQGYELPPGMFPPTAQYAALGHLHLQQEIPGPCPIFYSGPPLAVDFADTDIQNAPSVLIISAGPGIRADTRQVPVTGGRPLRTLRGTLDEVVAEGEQAGDGYLRVILTEPGRAGLADLIRDKLPNAVEVLLDRTRHPSSGSRGAAGASLAGRSPLAIFGDYLAEQNIVDPRLNEMFTELLDEVTAAASQATGDDTDTEARDDGGEEAARVSGQADRPAGWNASPDGLTHPDADDATADPADTPVDSPVAPEEHEGADPDSGPSTAAAGPWEV